MYELLSPEILQTGVVKGLISQEKSTMAIDTDISALASICIMQ